jgi:hypothetical protein
MTLPATQIIREIVMTEDVEAKPTFKGIATALASAQGEMSKAEKTANNAAFKGEGKPKGTAYATLSSVMDACMPALTSRGIAVIQPTGENEIGRYVKTILIHGNSGETLECTVPLIIGKQDMQGYGSAVTYARRYGLMSMAGIAPADDDGNAAAKAAPTQEDKPKSRDPWTATIISELPDDATSRDKAMAVSKALCTQWGRMGGAQQLGNEWDRRAHLIAGPKGLEGMHPDLHGTVIDAYENRMNTIKEENQQ